MARSVLLVTADLMTASRVQPAASRARIALATALSPAAAIERMTADQPALVILDLSMPALDPAEIVPRLKAAASPPRVIAFAPHVHEERLAAAQAAGCDEVLSRGQFTRRIDELLRSVAGPRED